jgi:hypothetical protein
MRRIVIIGEGDKGITAIKINEYDRISENKVSFWIFKCYLNTDLIIFKNTPEGIQLLNMITTKIYEGSVYNYLENLVIEKLTPEEIKKEIELLKQHYTEVGKQLKQKEIKSVLGIEL